MSILNVNEDAPIESFSDSRHKPPPRETPTDEWVACIAGAVLAVSLIVLTLYGHVSVGF